MTNAQVVASLNSKLSAAMGGNTGGRAFSLSQPYHNRAPIRQPDREAMAVNAGTATILKGHALSWTGRRVRLRTSTDAGSLFAGIALDDAVPGRGVRFLKSGLIGQAHLLFDGDQTFTAGARFQISATNPGRLVAGTDLPVLSVRSVEAYGAALEIIENPLHRIGYRRGPRRGRGPQLDQIPVVVGMINNKVADLRSEIAALRDQLNGTF